MTKVKQRVFHGVVARYHWHDARWFATVGWAPFVIAFAGMVTSSISYFGWSFNVGSYLGLGSFILTEGMLMLILYFIISMAFFAGGLEWYVLCRHCPCYEFSGKEHGKENRFYCLGNWGSPKLFKYNPGRISRFRQATFLGFTGFFLLFPIVYFVDRWEFVLFQLVMAVSFIVTLRHWACSQCPNFGCILNCVSEDDSKKFLEGLDKGEIYS
ncbi:MAG: hypothetical protein AM325_013980 [Candidatus Thorarchaeota archaeon SMTZ1-45]|nr:MAG: hypothetical protein AM325_15495 [Candidatus Thorarchaeota archaeon SMTZ1-45]